MGCREIFFAPARRKTLYFAHFGRAGAIFLSLRTRVKRWGALLGRYFFHGGSLEVAVVAVECLDEAEAPLCRVSVPGCGTRGWWLGLPQKSRMQFDLVKFQLSLKTL